MPRKHRSIRYTSGACTWTALVQHVQLYDLLVHSGAQINYRCEDVDNQAALHLAAEAGRLGFVKRLLKNGADTSLKDDQGKTALEIAKERSMR